MFGAFIFARQFSSLLQCNLAPHRKVILGGSMRLALPVDLGHALLFSGLASPLTSFLPKMKQGGSSCQ